MDVIFNKWFFSALIVGIVLLCKYALCRYIKRRYKQKGVDKRYLINNVKNLFNLALFIILMILWSAELQKFALSIAAFVVAIVLATKELILCFIGFLYISASAPFRVGDWIQLNDTVGEVSELDWAKVSIHEVDVHTYTYTGKSVFLPNSILITQPIRNLNYMRRYVNHHFNITFEKTEEFDVDILDALNQKALEYCSGFFDVAERYNALIENRLEVKIAGPEPEVKLTTTDIGKLKITFALFCPTEKAIGIEQQLTTDFFRLLQENSKKY